MIEFLCKKCGIKDSAVNIASIIAKEKRCISCINKDRDEKNKKHSQEYYKTHKTKQVVETSATCKYCGESFMRKNAEYCSSKCRSVGIKLAKLDKQSKQIANLKETASIEVYGANIQRVRGYINETTRKFIDD